MKILCAPGGFDFYVKPEDPSMLYARLCGADVKFKNKNIEFFDYGRWYWRSRRVVYKGIEYRIEREDEADVAVLSSFRDGHCYLVDNDGNRLVLKPELIYLITHTAFSKRKLYQWQFSKIAGKIFLTRRKSIFALVNIESQDVQTLEGVRLSNEYLLDNYILFFNRKTYHLTALKHDLQELWSFRPDVNFSNQNVRGPEVYSDLVIFSYGPSRSESFPGYVYNGEQFADQYRSLDSNLYALYLKDGSICWHEAIPKTIDNMVLQDDRLYISSTNEIHVLDPKTGKTEQVVDTGLSKYVDQRSDSSSLHIQGDKLYFCHQVDACLLVYNLNDLQSIKRIEIPPPYTIKDFEYYHEASDKLYFNLGPRFPREYYHTSPILELDPNDLNSEIEIFGGPPVEVNLIPSEDNKDEREIWVTIRDVPLDEAMVYAEMHTEDQAYYHGTHGMLGVFNKTDDFNGKVHFRYSGSDQSAEEVNEKLQILEERFSDWGRTIAYASTDPGKNATLEAKYIE
jgi:outer membrane protein assembly factor BamB